MSLVKALERMSTSRRVLSTVESHTALFFCPVCIDIGLIRSMYNRQNENKKPNCVCVHAFSFMKGPRQEPSQ